MDTNVKLEFLSKYTLNRNLKVELIHNVDRIENLNIPNVWKDIFREKNKFRKKERLIQLWSKYLEKELSNTIAYLKEFLEDIELMKVGDKISILYSIKSYRTGRTLYYEGGNPIDSITQRFAELDRDWDKLPKKIRDFYSFIHNGFYYYPSKSMGLDSIENVTYLDDYEWEIVDELGIEKIEINVKSSYGFFSNGTGTYVVIDAENFNDNQGVLWSSKSRPRYNLNFWDIVDEWIVIGFDC